MLLDLPSNRAEGWRWSDLSALPGIAAREPLGGVPEPLPWLDCDGPRVLFVDGRLDRKLSHLGPIEIGLRDGFGEEHALARIAGRATAWILKLGRDRAPPGVVQLLHVTTGAADHLATMIELHDGAQASVMETFVGDGWTNRLTEIQLGQHARLTMARRILTASGFVSLTDRAVVGEGASLTLTTLAAGGADTRLDASIVLAGEAAYAEAGAALLARGRQRHDANLVLRHERPGGTSRQVWRSVADDRSTCSVAARIEVARGAQKTDGEQSLKGIMLSRTATINAKPELEIFADDVKCAHGATVGELDPAALFYMASRGVPEAEAKALLTRAFVADAIDRIGEGHGASEVRPGDEPSPMSVREAFHADVEGWFG